jgi:hypothetical protein
MTLSVKKIACAVCLALQALWSFPALAAGPTLTVKVISEAGAQRPPQWLGAYASRAID